MLLLVGGFGYFTSGSLAAAHINILIYLPSPFPSQKFNNFIVFLFPFKTLKVTLIFLDL